MSDLWTALSSAVYPYLSQHPAFQATGAEYHMVEVPVDASYPYVVSPGDSLSRPWYTMSASKGEELIWSFHVWGHKDYGGPLKVQQVGDAVMEVMDDAGLMVPGYKLLMFRRVLSTMPMRQDGDPKLFQQVIRYRVMLEKE